MSAHAHRLWQLYVQLSCLLPSVFTSMAAFGNRYCSSVSRFGRAFLGSANLPELNLLMQHAVMVRRLSTDRATTKSLRNHRCEGGGPLTAANGPPAAATPLSLGAAWRRDPLRSAV